jgi:CheY-like chemotaxis protein
MLQRLIGADIEFVAVLDPELGRVKADAGQMEQVILNLAVNARDAMPGGGRLTIETRNEFLDEGYARAHLSLQPGAYVRLDVSDTGIGMDAETISRIFEPFFTTKEPGKGTGLGLSTVYGIVRQSGGSIWVYSEPGIGTTFKIYLPHVGDPVAQPETKVPEPDSPRGSETVLVVETDTSVRDLTCQSLRKYGYQVIEAETAGDALLACEKMKGDIQIMVTDLIMPRMSGPELASRVHQVRPGLKVLYMSGYADEAVVRLGFFDSPVPFIQKPFTAAALAIKVRETLGQRHGP